MIINPKLNKKHYGKTELISTELSCNMGIWKSLERIEFPEAQRCPLTLFLPGILNQWRKMPQHWGRSGPLHCSLVFP